jgi:hypothetical protein
MSSFADYCLSGNLEKAKELYSLNEIDLHENDDELFIDVCQNGHLNIAKWIISFDKLDRHSTYKKALKASCEYNNVDVYEWLGTLNEIDMKYYNNCIFRIYCEFGNLEKAKLLYSIDNTIDIHCDHDSAFNYSCLENHLLLAQWLYSLGGIDIHFEEDKAFRFSCLNGNLEIAQWLYSLGGIDIHMENDFPFRISSRYYQVDILTWLCSLTDNYIMINEKTFGYKIKKNSALISKLENPEKHIIVIDIDDICMICLTEEQYMCKLNCNHIYCCSCLKHYLKLDKTKCCYCQKEIDENSDKHLIYKKE